MEETVRKRLSAFLVTIFLVAGADANEHAVIEGSDNVVPELDCVIEPSEVVDVGSAVPGIVKSIYAYRSDLIKKGTIIAELESSVEQRTLELARVRAGLDTAIKLRQESAAFGYITQNRNQELLRKSAISIHDMDRLKNDVRIAELQVTQEKDNKHIAELEHLRALAVLHRRTIRSPVNGVVMERFKSVGEFVEDKPVIRVAQLDPLHVEVIVPVDYLGRIVQGMQAKVTPSLEGPETYLATVERVDRVADVASGTYGVQLTLANPEYKIPTGLRCLLDFLPLEPKEHEEIAGESGVLSANVLTASQQVNGAGGERELAPQTELAKQSELTTSITAIEPLVAESTESPEACYSIGPVTGEALARQLSERLEERSYALVLRSDSVDVDNGYLVLAAPEPDRQAIRRLVTRLDKAGISDRFILSRGDNKGRVSLGYFRGLQSAVKQKEQLAFKGFEAEIVPRLKEIKQYWLDVSLKAGSDLPGQFKEVAASLTPAASFKPLACTPQLVHR